MEKYKSFLEKFRKSGWYKAIIYFGICFGIVVLPLLQQSYAQAGDPTPWFVWLTAWIGQVCSYGALVFILSEWQHGKGEIRALHRILDDHNQF